MDVTISAPGFEPVHTTTEGVSERMPGDDAEYCPYDDDFAMTSRQAVS